MNPWNTLGNINIEYNGVVWIKGVAGIVGLNNFIVGLVLACTTSLITIKSIGSTREIHG